MILVILWMETFAVYVTQNILIVQHVTHQIVYLVLQELSLRMDHAMHAIQDFLNVQLVAHSNALPA